MLPSPFPHLTQVGGEARLAGRYPVQQGGQAVYFTSEEEARRYEREPAESDPEMAEVFSLMSDLRYFDLRDPWLESPK